METNEAQLVVIPKPPRVPGFDGEYRCFLFVEPMNRSTTWCPVRPTIRVGK